jgi:hypothetical protein
VLDRVSAAALDPTIGDADLDPAALTRRRLFRAAGILSRVAGGEFVGVTPAVVDGEAPPRPAATTRPRHWLAGDHHVHTVFSPDGRYTVLENAHRAHSWGLDWMVVTDHGGPAHVRVGVDRTAPEIQVARAAIRRLRVFQGLEWNIPGAEHGTVFVTPGPHGVDVLREFERDFDSEITGASVWTQANEALALSGIRWLGRQVDTGRVRGALFLANHPSRRGLDSPHEIRNWRDTDPRVAIGFEGAPGHQAAGLPTPTGAGENRGYYGRDRGTDPNQFHGYPQESYRTWGGFDWMTATVGGLWDALLSEGKPWCVTANSDCHAVHLHLGDRPPDATDAAFEATGRHPDPVYTGRPNTSGGDFWPGQYSRTVVGAADRGYRAIMDGLRDGRVWVDHGRLVRGIDVRVRRSGSWTAGVPLGSTLVVRPGTKVEVVVRIRLQDAPHPGGEVPKLNRLDVISGRVCSPGADRDGFTAPDTRVVKQWDTSGMHDALTLVHRLGPVEEPAYVRVRGTDARFSRPGLSGSLVDPAGPRMDPAGDADPWLDLWLYTNPIWVVPSSGRR